MESSTRSLRMMCKTVVAARAPKVAAEWPVPPDNSLWRSRGRDFRKRVRRGRGTWRILSALLRLAGRGGIACGRSTSLKASPDDSGIRIAADQARGVGGV